ncbi:MAG: endonuclease/exonuclease/phosphatase family protein [Pararhodobacter sp.]|nr:endonuclease/exonuclease/phosphatase family protein [Pararhodobacter sp.]
MRIMCLNGWGGTLNDELIAYLGKETPDVLCLQEVIYSPATDQDWLTYRDGDHVLPQRANFFRDVANALPGHAATFCPAAQGPLWDGDREVPSFWGLATFVRSTLPVIGQVQGFVYKDFTPDGFGAHPRARNAHGLRVHDPASDRSISITHMHGLRHPEGKSDTPERALQARQLLDYANQVSRPGDIRVICGDFNVAKDSETLSFLAQHGFTELVTEGRFKGTRTSHYKKPERFADYMLIDPRDAVHRFQVVYEPEVSDHCALLLDL